MTRDEIVEIAAHVAASAMDGYSEGASHIDHYRIIARALEQSGLLVEEPEATRLTDLQRKKIR